MKASLGSGGTLFAIVWFCAWLLVLIATGARRCRDVGINPHWVWLWLFPFVGNIFYIVLFFLEPDDGVRIARPTPKTRIAKPRMAKKGLVRYISVFGYATRQEYWCILLPVGIALTAASSIFFLVISFLFSFFEGYLLFDILYFSLFTASGWAVAWLCTATVVRRCRDAALDLRWSIVYLIPLWLIEIAFIPLAPMSSEQQTAMIEKFLMPLTQNFDATTFSMTTTSTITIILLLCIFFVFFLLLVAIFASYIVFGCLTSKELESKELANKEKA